MTEAQSVPVNIKRMLWSIMGACGAMCVGVVLAVFLILSEASDQRDREAIQTSVNRIGSCNQYNQQVLKTINNDRSQAENSARDLIKISNQANPGNPSPFAEIYIRSQANTAERTSRQNNPFRDCTLKGISSFLKLQSSVNCKADKKNPGFCIIDLGTTTTTITK